jgi:hypothetical protein
LATLRSLFSRQRTSNGITVTKSKKKKHSETKEIRRKNHFKRGIYSGDHVGLHRAGAHRQAALA